MADLEEELTTTVGLSESNDHEHTDANALLNSNTTIETIQSRKMTPNLSSHASHTE